MTLVFPRDFPDCRANHTAEFVPQYFMARSVTGGSLPQVIQLAPPIWRASYSVETLDREDTGTWEAWLHSLRAGLRTFKATPPKGRWPRAYPRGFTGLTVSGVAFTGSGTLTAIGTNRDEVTIGSLPVGFKIALGDWFSLNVGSRHHLHRFVEAATASGSGVVSTVSIEPPLRPNAVTSTAALFAAPYCEMVLSGDWSSRRNGAGASISFEAAQVL